MNKDEELDVPGRLLYCIDCEEFTRHAVQMAEEDKMVVGKAIICRICKTETARLLPWGDGKEWIDQRFVENLPILIGTVLGDKVMSQAFMPEKILVEEVSDDKSVVKKNPLRLVFGHLDLGLALFVLSSLGFAWLLYALALMGLYVYPFTLLAKWLWPIIWPNALGITVLGAGVSSLILVRKHLKGEQR